MSMFNDPAAPGGGLPWKDRKGALLLIEPLAVETGINTAYGVSDAVRANVYILDGTGAGEDYEDTLIFPKLLQSQTRSATGQKVLGRLGSGEAKPGQDPPHLLTEASAEDKALAEKWVNDRQQPATQAPAAPF